MSPSELCLPVSAILLGVTVLVAAVSPDAEAVEEELVWMEATGLTLEGKGWADTESPYDRLPAKAKGVVRDAVWDLSHHSAGLRVRFVTDAPRIHVRWTVLNAGLAMPHMPATGVSGVDLYAREANGRWVFIANGRPEKQSNEAIFPGGRREYALYLPLYNGTRTLEIGVAKGASLQPAEPLGKPVVFYGTSITQGGCASRPGLAAVAIVGRMLNVPTINLGFSGNGQMEPEMATLLAELDPACYVLDALWNMSPEMVRERVEPFVRTLRAAHPETPIVLAEDSSVRNAVPTAKGKLLRAIHDKLADEGMGKLYFVSAEGMLGEDSEGTVDGCHPNDLGFMRQAEVFARALKPLL